MSTLYASAKYRVGQCVIGVASFNRFIYHTETPPKYACQITTNHVGDTCDDPYYTEYIPNHMCVATPCGPTPLSHGSQVCFSVCSVLSQRNACGAGDSHYHMIFQPVVLCLVSMDTHAYPQRILKYRDLPCAPICRRSLLAVFSFLRLSLCGSLNVHTASSAFTAFGCS